MVDMYAVQLTLLEPEYIPTIRTVFATYCAVTINKLESLFNIVVVVFAIRDPTMDISNLKYPILFAQSFATM